SHGTRPDHQPYEQSLVFERQYGAHFASDRGAVGWRSRKPRAENYHTESGPLQRPANHVARRRPVHEGYAAGAGAARAVVLDRGAGGSDHSTDLDSDKPSAGHVPH